MDTDDTDTRMAAHELVERRERHERIEAAITWQDPPTAAERQGVIRRLAALVLRIDARVRAEEGERAA